MQAYRRPLALRLKNDANMFVSICPQGVPIVAEILASLPEDPRNLIRLVPA